MHSNIIHDMHNRLNTPPSPPPLPSPHTAIYIHFVYGTQFCHSVSSCENNKIIGIQQPSYLIHTPIRLLGIGIDVIIYGNKAFIDAFIQNCLHTFLVCTVYAANTEYTE